MSSYSSKPIATRYDFFRTVAQAITAACLLTITIGFLVAGTYTVHKVEEVQTTYHPEKLASLMNTAAETVETLHKTTHMLGASRQMQIFDDLHRLVGAAEAMSKNLEHMPMDKLLEESQTWRKASGNFLRGIKSTIDEF
jgi:hypothetical protein